MAAFYGHRLRKQQAADPAIALAIVAFAPIVEAGVDVNVIGSATTSLVAAIEARDTALMTYLEQHGARENP
jgi:hypothetical protein